MCIPAISFRRMNETGEVVEAASITNDVAKVAEGIFAGLAELPILGYIENKICEILTYYKFDLSNPQEIIQVWEYVEKIGSSLLRGASMAALLFYVVILGPLIEEVVFRGYLNPWIKEKMIASGYDLSQSLHYALYLTICGCAFGVCHLSPVQGWVNIPIFIATTLGGVFLSALKDEETNDLTAPCAAHMTHNGVAMAVFLALKA